MPIFNTNHKFDIQFREGEIAVQRLAELLTNKKIEHKSESYLWRRSGNLCIEYACDGKPSGIATTEAEWWSHELMDDDRQETVAIILVPVARLQRLCTVSRRHENGGDGGRFSNYLVRILDIFRW